MKTKFLIFSLALTTILWSGEEAHDHAGHTDHADHAEHLADGESETDRHNHDAHAERDNESNAQDDHANDEEGHGEHDSIVRIEPEVLQEFGITLGSVGAGKLYHRITLPGEIRFNREALAYVTPRYAATVLDIKARLADKVTKGQVLATLESTDTLRPIEVKAPIDGTIVDYNLTPGQTVEAGSMLFTVADLSTVWADLQVYQRDMAIVKVGQSVRIEGGHGMPSFEGRLAYLAPTVDEHTRTGLARVIVANSESDWKPGQFIKGHIDIETQNAGLVVPRSAVLTHEGEAVVFVQTDAGFEPRPIELGASDADYFSVLSGLTGGEIIATQNPISLKAEMGKASFGGHAGHVH